MSIKPLLFALLIAFSTVPAFADELWVVTTTDKPQYFTGETMEVSGYVLERKMPVIAMSVYDPDGTILSANNVELQEDDGFAKTISLDSPFFDKSGIYVIEFDYGKNSEQITFEIVGAEQPTPVSVVQSTPEVIFLDTDKDTYSDDEFITISGIVSKMGDSTILIGVYDQNDFPTGFYTPQIGSDLEFSVSFLAKSGVNFKTPGKYYVKAHYGESKQTIDFEFVDSSPIPQINQELDEPEPPQIVQLQPQQPQAAQPKIQEPEKEKPVQIDQPEPQNLPEPIIDEDLNNLSVEDEELGKMLNEITLSCDSSEYAYTILYYDGMGPALMRLCNYDQAITYFDESLIKNPNNIEALTNKATAYGKLGKLDVAIEYYDMVLGIDPSFEPALNNKANALAQLGRFEEAISIYNSISDDLQAQANLQKAQENFARYAEAQLESEEPSSPVQETSSLPTMEISEPPKRSEDFIEQIGSIFASFFGFLS